MAKGEVRYYTGKELLTDTAFLSGLTSAVEQIIAEAAQGKVNFSNFIKFSAKTTLPVQIVSGAIDITINDDRATVNGVTIAGGVTSAILVGNVLAPRRLELRPTSLADRRGRPSANRAPCACRIATARVQGGECVHVDEEPNVRLVE